MIDIVIIVLYFAAVLGCALYGGKKVKKVSSEEFFLSSRSLKWPSIAFSTIATNIHAGHFLGMAGSAYIFGLAQANFEINAIFGLLLAAFIFVPFYLKKKIYTISQFFEEKFGPRIALFYCIGMIILYGFVYAGSVLFWGAYSVNEVFPQFTQFLGKDAPSRIIALIFILGIFSAIYTYFGGLTAVVKTDIIQLGILMFGGITLTILAVVKVGGWSNLFKLSSTQKLLHLHLPANHPTLPWTGIITMLLLNLNYWGANQVILQRALAAKNLRHAQIGLLVGGIFKYITAAMVVIPSIALVGFLQEKLPDPDKAYTTLVNVLLPSGLKGLVLCGLFASMMSSIDSIFNSVSTLWTIDIYKRYINPQAKDEQTVKMGRLAIVAVLISGITFGLFNVYVKFTNPEFPVTHWFNELSYFIKVGFVLLIIAAIFFKTPSRKLLFLTLIESIVITVLFKILLPSMSYLNRTGIAIIIIVSTFAIPTIIRAWSEGKEWKTNLKNLIQIEGDDVAWFGANLFLSLVLCHIFFR